MLAIDLMELYKQEREEYELAFGENTFPSFRQWKAEYEEEYEVRVRLSEDTQISVDDLEVDVTFKVDDEYLDNDPGYSQF